MKKKLFAFLFIVVTIPLVKAQCLWTSAEIGKSLTNCLGVSVKAEYRTHDGMSSTERWAGTVALDYKLCDFLKMSAGYIYLHQHTENKVKSSGDVVPAYWQPKHRGIFVLTGSYKFGDFSFSLRERYQCTYRGEQSVPKYDATGGRVADEIVSEEYKHVLRSRLGVEYKKKDWRATPYAQAELHSLLTKNMGKDQIRYTLGTSYKLNGKNSLGLFYRFIDKQSSDDLHVIGVEYKFKL